MIQQILLITISAIAISALGGGLAALKSKTKKSIVEYDRFSSVDLAGFAPATLLVKGRVLTA